MAAPVVLTTALVLTPTGSDTNEIQHLLQDQAKNGTVKNDAKDSESATKNRVKPRKGTLEKVKENQPKNEDGEMLDPNKGQVLDPEKTDLGYKPGNEWRTRKKMHQEKGSTRKEVLEAENNPDLYHYEESSSNRSHKHG